MSTVCVSRWGEARLTLSLVFENLIYRGNYYEIGKKTRKYGRLIGVSKCYLKMITSCEMLVCPPVFSKVMKCSNETCDSVQDEQLNINILFSYYIVIYEY